MSVDQKSSSYTRVFSSWQKNWNTRWQVMSSIQWFADIYPVNMFISQSSDMLSFRLLTVNKPQASSNWNGTTASSEPGEDEKHWR